MSQYIDFYELIFILLFIKQCIEHHVSVLIIITTINFTKRAQRHKVY